MRYWVQNLRRDGVNTSVLDRLPSLLPDVLGGGLELLSGDLAGPVSLNGLQKWDVSTDLYFIYFTADKALVVYWRWLRLTFFMARLTPIRG